jgi:hypothetical protein
MGSENSASRTPIAVLIAFSMAVAFGAVVIVLSKVGTIVNPAGVVLEMTGGMGETSLADTASLVAGAAAPDRPDPTWTRLPLPGNCPAAWVGSVIPARQKPALTQKAGVRCRIRIKRVGDRGGLSQREITTGARPGNLR